MQTSLQQNSIKFVSQNYLFDDKTLFLQQLLSKNPQSKNKYKRFIKSPLRYAGGKSRAVGYIVELIPNNIKKIVSPFIGGGAIEIACATNLNMEVIGYDIFDILVNYWQHQLNRPEKLYKKLLEFQPTKDGYNEVKERLKKHWKDEEKLNGLDLASHYYFNHNLSYGPGFLGWASKVYLNEKRYSSILNKVRNFRAPNLKVFKGSFEETIKKHPNDFLYCDPPYYLNGDSKMFKGIYPQRNFPIHHNGFNHKLLYELLSKHKGGFILSYNNCSTIREWYSKYEVHNPSWQYTMGQGETRIGENRKNGNGNNVKASHELLIYGEPK